MRFIVQGFRASALLLFAVLAPIPLDAAPWIETSNFFHAGGGPSDYLGSHVALDGDVAVAGLPFPGLAPNPSGIAYVFVRSGGVWSEAAKLLPAASAANDDFGFSVAISGDTIVVGSPGATSPSGVTREGIAYVYTRPDGGWAGTLTPSAVLAGPGEGAIAEEAGFSVGISGDTAVVGAIYAANQDGAVFVFEKPSSGWSGVVSPSGELLASDGLTGDQLGYSVGISADTVVAGAPANGGSAAGKAYVWVKPPGGWGIAFQSEEVLPSDPVASESFGEASAIDGDTVVVTNLYTNSSDPTPHEKGYVFLKPGTGWSGTANEDAQLVGADVTNAFWFGQSTSISGDTIVIGAPEAPTFFTSLQEGAAYIFDKPSTGWSGSVFAFAKVYRGSGPTADAFGYAVAISGTTLLSGAPGETIGGNPSQGAVHVFEPGLNPTATASFAPGSVYTFQPSTLSLSVTNPNTTGFLSNLGFAAAPSSPAGLGLDSVPNASTTCGGILFLGSPQFLIGMYKGNLPASSSCGLSVNVSSGLPNTYTTLIPASSLTFVPFYCDQGCYGASSNTAALLVRLRPTQIRFLVRGPIRVAPGVPVELRFEVSAKRSEIQPTGEVVVSDGAGHSCRSAIDPAAGAGSCSLTFGAPGNYRVHAEYLGNVSFAASTSPAEPVLVGGAGR